jgi:hypothetical protein
MGGSDLYGNSSGSIIVGKTVDWVKNNTSLRIELNFQPFQRILAHCTIAKTFTHKEQLLTCSLG